MKTLAKLLLSIACVGLLSNCEKDEKNVEHFDPNQPRPFTAEFVVWDYSATDVKVPDEKKGCLRIWKGEGNSVLMGDFYIEISLTCFIQPGKTCGSFCNLTGAFITKRNGDELYFTIEEGDIVCNKSSSCNEFETCITDLATITGGTGIFRDAKGSFNPNAFIHNGENDKWYANFYSEGNIWPNIIFNSDSDKTIGEEEEF